MKLNKLAKKSMLMMMMISRVMEEEEGEEVSKRHKMISRFKAQELTTKTLEMG